MFRRITFWLSGGGVGGGKSAESKVRHRPEKPSGRSRCSHDLGHDSDSSVAISTENNLVSSEMPEVEIIRVRPPVTRKYEIESS